MRALSFAVAAILTAIASVSHLYDLGIRTDNSTFSLFATKQCQIDIPHVLLFAAVCLIGCELLRFAYTFITYKCTKASASLIVHFRRGCFGVSHCPLDAYSTKDMAVCLPIIVESILSIPFNVASKHHLLSNLAIRIQSDASLFQAFSFYVHSNQSIASRLEDAAQNSPTLRKTVTLLLDRAARNKSGLDYFHDAIYKITVIAPQTIKASRTKIPVPRDVVIYDPVHPTTVVSHCKVKKVMASNAKPLLIECWSRRSTTSPCSRVLLKYGDDLRKDAAVLLFFRFVNYIWKTKGMQYHGEDVACFVYDVVPMSEQFGAIELVDECIKIADIDKTEEIRNSMKRNMSRLVASAVGSYLCSFLVGVRDRHHDNILIKKDEGILFHIDFAYVLGETVSGLDACVVAISRDFVKVLGEERWREFVRLGEQSYVVLRDHRRELLQFACLVFGYAYTESIIRQYLRKTLAADSTEQEAVRWVSNKFREAPGRLQTKMKNVIHDIAVWRIST